tara:strand:+ start:1801 stop:1965 length:165 start_codon:yes stop_codon:yes gene_type:complete
MSNNLKREQTQNKSQTFDPKSIQDSSKIEHLIRIDNAFSVKIKCLHFWEVRDRF